MRRILSVYFVLLLILLSACSSNEKEDTAKNEGESNEHSEENVDVDKGLLNVEITIPASMYEGQDIDTVIADSKKEGIEVTKNEDGSLTYKMSKKKHKEMMKEMGESITASLEEMRTDEEYVSIKDITYNKSFTEFTLLVDKAAYEDSMDAFAVIGLGFTGAMYQMYNGTDPDDSKVTVFVKDEATQEIFDQTVYPDDLEEETEE